LLSRRILSSKIQKTRYKQIQNSKNQIFYLLF